MAGYTGHNSRSGNAFDLMEQLQAKVAVAIKHQELGGRSVVDFSDYVDRLFGAMINNDHIRNEVANILGVCPVDVELAKTPMKVSQTAFDRLEQLCDHFSDTELPLLMTSYPGAIMKGSLNYSENGTPGESIPIFHSTATDEPDMMYAIRNLTNTQLGDGNTGNTRGFIHTIPKMGFVRGAHLEQVQYSFFDALVEFAARASQGGHLFRFLGFRDGFYIREVAQLGIAKTPDIIAYSATVKDHKLSLTTHPVMIVK